MKRLTLLGAIVAVAAIGLPGAASAARLSGVVVAKDSARKTIAVASSGQVRTVRVAKPGAVAVGRRVDVTGTRLADGTFRAQKVRQGKPAKSVSFGAVVVRNDAAANQRLIVSAGGTVFAVRYTGGPSFASEGTGLEPGDQVKVSADVDKTGLEAGEGDVKETGHVGQLKIEGIFIKGGNDGFDVAVVHRGLVRVHFKLGTPLPTWKPGDLIVLVVTVNHDGSFTLVLGRSDDRSGKTGDDGKGTGDTGKTTPPAGDSVTVTGKLGDREGGKVSVLTDGGVVTCTVPSTMNISVFTAGEKVTMYCKKRDGVFVLAAMKSERASVSDPGTKDPAPTPTTSAGVLVEGPAGTVTIKLEDGSTVSCKAERPLPAGMFKLGDRVKLTCTNGALGTIKSELGFWSPASNEIGWGGTLGAGSGGTITVARDTVSFSCSMAAGLDVTAVIPLGSKVWMSCKYREGVLVLGYVQTGDITVKSDGTGERSSYGTLAERAAETVTITREDGSKLTCAAPSSIDLSAFHAGDKVKMRCRLSAGVWRLSLLSNGTTTVEVPL